MMYSPYFRARRPYPCSSWPEPSTAPDTWPVSSWVEPIPWAATLVLGSLDPVALSDHGYWQAVPHSPDRLPRSGRQMEQKILALLDLPSRLLALQMALLPLHIASQQQMEETVPLSFPQLPAVDAPTLSPILLRMTVASVALSSQDKGCQRCSSSCRLCKSQSLADASCRSRSETAHGRNEP